TSWDAPEIRGLNPTFHMPATRIVVVHRARGSGTSHAFAEFLHASGHWPDSASASSPDSVFSVGVSAEGNEGIAAEVKATIGAIGYVELTYARQNRLAFAAVQGKDGTFVLPGAD